MTHACTTVGDEAGVWAYCADCNWMGPVYTPDDPPGSELPWWFDAFRDISHHQKKTAE